MVESGESLCESKQTLSLIQGLNFKLKAHEMTSELLSTAPIPAGVLVLDENAYARARAWYVKLLKGTCMHDNKSKQHTLAMKNSLTLSAYRSLNLHFRWFKHPGSVIS